MKKIAVLLIAVVVAGCSATGERFRPEDLSRRNESVATVYVYRNTALFTLGGVAPDFTVDGRGNYVLRNNGYKRFEFTPGEHSIEVVAGVKTRDLSFVEWPPSAITIKAEPGQEYFIAYRMREVGYTKQGITNARNIEAGFQLVERAVAEKELLNTKRID